MKNLLYLSLISLSVLFLSSCGEAREEFKVEKTDIVEAVYSSVSVKPEHLYSLYTKVPGQIVKLNVEVGDTVMMGDIICYMDAVSALNNSENAQLNLNMISNQLSGESSLINDLENQIVSAQYEQKIDSSQLARLEYLKTSGNATIMEVEQAELKLNYTKTKLKGLIAQRDRLEKELKIQRRQAQNNYLSSLSTSEGSTVISLLDGVVYDLFKENGEFVMGQEPVGLVGSGDAFILELLIDEVDIVSVKPGQTIVVELEAYPGKTFEAIVDHVYPKLNPANQSFMVVGKFVEDPPTLYLGLTGEANIVIEERKDVLVIPRNYLVDDTHVETSAGLVEVATGIKSLTHVEITKGLSEGTVIYLPE